MGDGSEYVYVYLQWISKTNVFFAGELIVYLFIFNCCFHSQLSYSLPFIVPCLGALPLHSLSCKVKSLKARVHFYCALIRKVLSHSEHTNTHTELRTKLRLCQSAHKFNVHANSISHTLTLGFYPAIYFTSLLFFIHSILLFLLISEQQKQPKWQCTREWIVCKWTMNCVRCMTYTSDSS